MQASICRTPWHYTIHRELPHGKEVLVAISEHGYTYKYEATMAAGRFIQSQIRSPKIKQPEKLFFRVENRISKCDGVLVVQESFVDSLLLDKTSL